MKKFTLIILILLLCSTSFSQIKVDKSIKPDNRDDEISEIYKDMVVVQRKAKEKADKWLFFPYMSFDFSDGPVTMYGLNLDFGYALSDFWEIYLNYVPMFIVNERDIVAIVEKFELSGGKKAEVTVAEPQSQIGLEVNWVPAYGKDSWGPYSIIRSDTFLKFGAGNIIYEGGSGLRFNFNLGKTYYVSDWFNLRLTAGGSYLETIVQDIKSFKFIGILEIGTVFYF